MLNNPVDCGKTLPLNLADVPIFIFAFAVSEELCVTPPENVAALEKVVAPENVDGPDNDVEPSDENELDTTKLVAEILSELRSVAVAVEIPLIEPPTVRLPPTIRSEDTLSYFAGVAHDAFPIAQTSLEAGNAKRSAKEGLVIPRVEVV